MMIKHSYKITSELLKKAISLESYGLNELGWDRNSAFELIDQLTIPILGGDVYQFLDGRLVSTYNNWYCEPLKDESKDAYLERSKLESFKYIQNYGNDISEEYIFVIVA